MSTCNHLWFSPGHPVKSLTMHSHSRLLRLNMIGMKYDSNCFLISNIAYVCWLSRGHAIYLKRVIYRWSFFFLGSTIELVKCRSLIHSRKGPVFYRYISYNILYCTIYWLINVFVIPMVDVSLSNLLLIWLHLYHCNIGEVSYYKREPPSIHHIC